jgi:hypothetical protein
MVSTSILFPDGTSSRHRYRYAEICTDGNSTSQTKAYWRCVGEIGMSNQFSIKVKVCPAWSTSNNKTLNTAYTPSEFEIAESQNTSIHRKDWPALFQPASLYHNLNKIYFPEIYENPKDERLQNNLLEKAGFSPNTWKNRGDNATLCHVSLPRVKGGGDAKYIPNLIQTLAIQLSWKKHRSFRKY